MEPIPRGRAGQNDAAYCSLHKGSPTPCIPPPRDDFRHSVTLHSGAWKHPCFGPRTTQRTVDLVIVAPDRLTRQNARSRFHV